MNLYYIMTIFEMIKARILINYNKHSSEAYRTAIIHG